MPPAIILSPYSGRPVKVREQDLGRALRDEQGRVFYVVEDPEHGRYAARTRKGSPKDLERYREIEAKTAQLDDHTQPTRDDLAQAHDAAGKKRKNPAGLLLLVVIAAVLVALGYVYLKHPGLLGLEPAKTEPANDTDASSERSAKPEATRIVKATTTASTAATPLTNTPDERRVTQPPTGDRVKTSLARIDLTDDMANDPRPIYVSQNSQRQQAEQEATRPTPRVNAPLRTVPIAFTPGPTRPARQTQTKYDDFRHTASGLRYKITHLTDGPSARAGNYLTVRYTAQTLDGKPLINDATQSFTLAAGQAIRAFDEGLAGIREGEQLRLLVPRGHSDQGTLPGIERLPDAPFLMDIQLVSVRPGVTYIIEKHGDPISRPTMPGDTVELHYLARVEGRDEVIDATVHHDRPYRLTLGNNEVIPGLEMGITGMRPGESRQLTIPPYLAYGRHSVAGGLIPEDAVLSFRVTLVQIVEDDQ